MGALILGFVLGLYTAIWFVNAVIATTDIGKVSLSRVVIPWIMFWLGIMGFVAAIVLEVGYGHS